MRRTRPRSDARAGQTALELLLVLGLFGVVLTSAFSLWRSQHRFYIAYVARVETWDAVRAATEILGAELRGVSPAAGDLYGLAADSVALRSFVGFGLLCGLDSAAGAWLVRGVSGSFETLPRDSALVFVEGAPERWEDGRWEVVHLSSVNPAQGASCADGRAVELRLRADRSVEGVRPGAPIRAFRPYVYRTYRDREGRWWMGRRLRGGTIQPVVGPLRPPGEGGLVFQGLDGSGGPATRVPEVRLVRVRVRGASAVAGSIAAESAATAVFLRNADYGSRAR